MSARSMTGFARVRKSLPEGELVVSIKSVNHRGLDLHFHLSPELDPFENALRQLIKSRVARGHLQINVNLTRASAAGSSVNRALLDAYLAAFYQASRELDIPGEPDLNSALRIPGMLRAEAEADSEASLEPALAAAAEEALTALNGFRQVEGAAIVEELRARCASIRATAERVEELRSQALEAFHKRLEERLAELLKGASLDPQRVAQEAAILAERSDVAEELMRLKTHTAQLDRLLVSGGEIGKRLDFLLQEMNRETNTLLSKTSGLAGLGLAITELGLAAKAEIDKIREQSLNLE
jgi:uncharacterized protein (TIGR00255 family)